MGEAVSPVSLYIFKACTGTTLHLQGEDRSLHTLVSELKAWSDSAAGCNLTGGLHKSIHKYPMFSILGNIPYVTNTKLLAPSFNSFFLLPLLIHPWEQFS